MNRRNPIRILLALTAIFFCADAHALTLDWGGYFRADHDYVNDYQMNKAEPGYSNMGGQGEDVAGDGKRSTTFTTFFMKLKPRVLVNDNIILHSEWNVGDPVYGFFGRNVPNEDHSNPLSTGKGNMDLSVARLWLDVHSDFGTIQVGRAPMSWGMGVIFNAGDNPFDRYQSTSDTIRLISKFGYLSLMPLYEKNTMGTNLAGAANPLTQTVLQGTDDVTDYGIGLRYDNPEEDLDAGALYFKRNANDSQTDYYFPAGATSYTSGSNGINMKLFDLYAKKTWHHLNLGAEVPIWNGVIGDVNGVGQRNTYKATALALEASLKYDTWTHSLKAGTVPGQAPEPTGNRGTTFTEMQFHRSYKLGMILFNYNLNRFGNVNPDRIPLAQGAGNPPANFAYPSYGSPYDADITNAKYLMLSTEKHWEQWGINAGIVWARANNSAQAGLDDFSASKGVWITNSQDNQAKNMGLEFDIGTRYNWDDNISFGADAGLFLPGAYFKYINGTPTTTGAPAQGPANSVAALSFTAATVF